MQARQPRIFETFEYANRYRWWNFFMGTLFWASLFLSGGQVAFIASLVFLCAINPSWDKYYEAWIDYNQNERMESGRICCDARTYAWTSVATGAVIIGGFILVYSTIALAVVVTR